MVYTKGARLDSLGQKSYYLFFIGYFTLVLTTPVTAQDSLMCGDIDYLQEPVIRMALRGQEPSLPVAGNILYVDQAAEGQGTGASWQDAYVCLQDALAVAVSGEQIWVAQGTYRPDEGINRVKGDVHASLDIPSGVAVYGGFPPYGGVWGERDPNRFPTILSGDLKGDDQPGFWFHTDNSYHVLTLTNPDPNTILNGFWITGGNAFAEEGHDSLGGGMLIQGGQPMLQNCRFQGNRGRRGGAIFHDRACPTMIRCVFTSNLVMDRGGAIYNDPNSKPVLVNCRFIDNFAVVSGGAMENAGDLSSPLLINCLFAMNRAASGGALTNQGSSQPVLWNCVLYGNAARERGGGIWNLSMDSTPSLANCILWRNTVDNNCTWECQVCGGQPDIRYSCIQGWDETRPGPGNIGVRPYFANPEQGDFHLKSLAGRWNPIAKAWVHDYVSSPCLDTGDPSANWFNEHWPHGERINMGIYGGTPYASLAIEYSLAPGDADRDFKLDELDVQIMGQQWLQRGVLPEQDINRDGVVNLVDFAFLAEQWRWYVDEPLCQ